MNLKFPHDKTLKQPLQVFLDLESIELKRITQRTCAVKEWSHPLKRRTWKLNWAIETWGVTTLISSWREKGSKSLMMFKPTSLMIKQRCIHHMEGIYSLHVGTRTRS